MPAFPRSPRLCAHRAVVATLKTTELFCRDCGLENSNRLTVAINDRLNAVIAALDHLGIGRCDRCDALLPKADLLWLREFGVEDRAEETLGHLYCAGCAVLWLDSETDDAYTETLTDDQLRWFGEHHSQMPSWLREVMTDRIGYRSEDL